MFSTGVSNRHHEMKLSRVFHMIVRDDNASTGWRMWCSYGLAREDNPAGYGNYAKFCAKCKELVADAVADETMSYDDEGKYFI